MYKRSFKLEGSSELLNKITYASIEQLRNVIRYLDAFSDSNDLSVLADIKTVLGFYSTDDDLRVLTPKEKTAIIEHLINDKSQSEVARLMGISQQAVSQAIRIGLKRIQQFLTNEEITKMHWTDEQKSFLLANYELLGPDKTAQAINKPKQKTIGMYHVLLNARKRSNK
jgi:predicted DNA-binding protein YlxM (UPF0122 family)